jgi:hypothetical protein
VGVIPGVKAGETEVQQLQDAGGGEEQILGLDVAVDDALGVGGGEAASGLCGEGERLARREGATTQAGAERRAVEDLRDDEGASVLGADVEDGDDVDVRESGGGPRLALEALQATVVARDSFGQDLERDLAAEAGVAGAVDLAHASCAQSGDDFVRAEAIARREHARTG